MLNPSLAVSAIVPTYNRSALLTEALRSIAAQTRPVAEILVWDDGSTDGTEAVVAELAREIPAIRYRRAENAGKSSALNRAMTEIAGDAVWICDDDDVCRPDAAEKMAAAMEASGAPVVGGRYERFGVDPGTGATVAADPGYWPDLSSGSLLRHLLEDVFIFQNATLARRSAYDRVGPFREDLPRSIDYDMIVRLAARHPVAFVDEPLFDQRKHEGARGPAAARHEATRMDDVWRRADQTVFEGFRDTLPLSLYEAMFEGDEPHLIARAARLQRAAVYSRRGLWDMALEDFEAAADIAGPVGAVERAICRRALAGKHGVADLPAPPVAGRVVALRRRSPVGEAIAAVLGHGLRWRCREAAQRRRLAEAAHLTRLCWRLGGAAPMAAPPNASLSERSALPEAAYQW